MRNQVRSSILFMFVIIAILLFGFMTDVTAQPYYVALSGDDENSGSSQNPFRTIEKAVSVVLPGETIYIKSGTFELTSAILISKSGASDALISLFALPGTRPVLDFSGQPFGGSRQGIKLTGSFWHIKGISIKGAGDNGMKIEGGTNNIIEGCYFYRNRDSGLQLDNGASNNIIRNCDSFYNADPPDYGDADGFAPKLTVGSGNYFFGCRAWKNCDDGWDGYMRDADDASTFIENCWAFENGYLEDGTDPGTQANGNGFKMGGSDDKTLMHNFTLKNCLAFNNKSKGFDQNSNKGSMILYNCTGQGNLVADYRITTELADGKVLVVKNCAVLGTAQIGSFSEQEKNSWLPPFVVTDSDFRSLDGAVAYGPRQPDGSLPYLEYMRPAPGSDLIDGGVNVGLPYAGLAPDLGCFETGTSGINDIRSPMVVQCYPNPVNENGVIQFTLASEGKCEIKLYDITGRLVKTLADQLIEPGEQKIRFDMSGFPDGIYVYRIFLNSYPVVTARLIKVTGRR